MPKLLTVSYGLRGYIVRDMKHVDEMIEAMVQDEAYSKLIINDEKGVLMRYLEFKVDYAFDVIETIKEKLKRCGFTTTILENYNGTGGILSKLYGN